METGENTLAAFESALARGATGLESDVWVTRDGVPVLSHDRAIGGRPIPETPRAELPEAVADLAGLFGRCGTGFALSLDVCDPDPRTAARIIEVVAAHGDPAQLYLCGAAAKAREWLALDARPHPVASVPSGLHGPAFLAHVHRLADLGVQVVNQRGARWTRHRVDAVHRAGLLAFGWGVQTRWQLGRLRRLGIDGVYSDHLELLARLAQVDHRAP